MRECHMRSLSACQNEPHCSEAGECVLYLAIGTKRAEAYRYLRRVFEHCAPQCTPLPDMLGLCTQIDNLIAGYRIDLGLTPDPAIRRD